uniref:Calponin-homology (CH) domain-containing protein n=1 Tax=Onchocerca volvulus TaxID=6282 RepID=A0A8R1XLC6_ONCVO
MSETQSKRKHLRNGYLLVTILSSGDLKIPEIEKSISIDTGLHVEDLFVDLTDGYNLIALLEALSAEKLPRENGYTRFHRIQNVQYCLDFLKRKNIKTVNIRPEDIVEGNPKLTLGLIWTIILNFQVSVIKQRQRGASDSQVCHYFIFSYFFK